MAELTEIMRQRGYQMFIDLVNNIRVGQYQKVKRIQVQQRKINIKSSHVILIYSENNPEDDNNISKLSKLNYVEITQKSMDVFFESMLLDLQI